MAYFKVEKFNGVAPAISARRLNNNFAQDATSVDFESGKLVAQPADEVVTTSSTSASIPIQSIYPYEYKIDSFTDATNTDLIIDPTSAAGGYFLFGYFIKGSFYSSNNTLVDDINAVYVTSSTLYNYTTSTSTTSYGLVVYLRDQNYGTVNQRTTPFTSDHLGTNTSLKIYTNSNFTDGQIAGAETGGAWILDFDNASETGLTFTVSSVGTAYWIKTITKSLFDSLFNPGTTHHLRFSNALTPITATLATDVNKTYISKPNTMFGAAAYPPIRYIATNYYGAEAFLWAEYIKVAGDKRTDLLVGSTLTGSSSGRTATVSFFEYDGTNTFIFFERTHFIGAGTHTGSDNQATVLTDSAETYNTSDDILIGSTLTNYKLDGTDSATGVVLDNAATAQTVTVNDLFSSGVANNFDTGDRYTIAVEPNVLLHTADFKGGTDYWDMPGVTGIFTGFHNPWGDSTDSNATSRSGFGLDPYFANHAGTVFTKTMERTRLGTDGSTLNYEYADDYLYDWTTFHSNHPISKLAGAIGNMGCVLAFEDAITSDANTSGDRTASDAATPGASKITLEQGDIVCFKGFGTASDGSALNVALVNGNNTNNGSQTSIRDVATMMNFEATPTTSAATPITPFADEHGGPYWQILDVVKVHVLNGIHTVLDTNQSIVTGSKTNSGTSATTLTDGTKNFPVDFDLLIGKTLVNVTGGTKGTIVSNTANTITVDDLVTITDDDYGEFDAARLDGNFAQYDEYYILEPIPATTSINGQILTESFYKYRCLSLASLDQSARVWTERTPSFGVGWAASRYAGETVTVKKPYQQIGKTYLEFKNRVKVAKTPVTSDKFKRLYWTGETYPAVAGQEQLVGTTSPGATRSRANISKFRLGIPTPRRPMSVGVAEGEQVSISSNTKGTASNVSAANAAISTLLVSYVYTFVSAFGEEGPPSAPSIPTRFGFGQSLVLSNIGSEELNLMSNSEYNFAENSGAIKRIYRSNTGSADTLFQFVDEIPFSNTAYIDTKDASFLGEVLPSTSWIGPPNDDEFLYPDGPMQGLTEMANGMFAGFSGTRLCFSEAFLPHAWPVEYRRTVEDKIVALGAVSNGIFVLTEGKPYFFSGNDGSVMVGTQIDFAQACINVDSVVDMGESVFYAGPDGLCSVSTSGADIITAGLISYHQWINTYKAQNYIASKHEGKYVAFFTDPSESFGGWQFDPTTPESALSNLTRSATALTVYNDPSDDNLYVVEGVNIKQFGGSNTAVLPYVWKSKKFVAPYPVSMSYVSVHADEYPLYDSGASATPKLEIAVAADGVEIFKANLAKTAAGVLYQETTTPSGVADFILYESIMRLPSALGIEWEITITGDKPVNEVCLAQSTQEMKAI